MAGSTMASDLPIELPELPGGWRYAPLATLIEESRGICYGIVQPGSHSEDGVPIVRVNNIRDGWIATDDVLRVSGEIESKYKRSRLVGGEVIVSLVGSLGETAIVPLNLSGWNVARAVGILPITKNVGPRWVHICLRSSLIQHYIQTWATTTVQATFNLRDLAKLPIPMPPENERLAISGILGSLDDKIELNRRRSRTLEQMARAIFQSWFVDFDPVHAKAAVRREHPSWTDAQVCRAACPRLQPSLAALFPDSFQDSPLGPIPRDWRISTVGEVCEFAYGKALKSEERRPGKVAVMGSNGQVGVHDKALVSGPGVVVGRKGNPGIVTWINGDFFPIDTTFYVVPKKDTCPLSYFSHALYAMNLGRLGADSAVPGLNRTIAYQSHILVPSKSVLDRFEHYDLAVHNQIEATDSESRTLAALRDTLLPKLISGELRVPEAERIAGRGA